MQKLFTLSFLFLILNSLAQCPWNFTVSPVGGSYTITCANINPIALQTVNNNTNAVSYFWTGPSFTSAAATATVVQAGTYSVVATDAVNSCTVLQTFQIYINAFIPSNTVTPASQSVSCSNNLISFNAAVSDPTITVRHDWYHPLNPMPGGVPAFTSTGTVSVYSGSLSPGIYTLVTTNIINGCSSTTNFTVTSSSNFPTFNVTSSTNFSVGCTPQNQTTLNLINPVSTQTPATALGYTMFAPGVTYTAPPWTAVTQTITGLAGTWSVCVHDYGNNCVTNLPIQILQSPVSANFVYTVFPSGLANFTSTSTGTTINTTYNWNFGDVTSSSGAVTAHTYSNGGVHNVTLNTNSPNCSVTFTVDVNTVPCVVNPNWTLVPSGVPKNWYAIPAYFGNVTAALWNWGDLDFDNTLYPVHTYTSQGTHTICLTVTVSCATSSMSCSSYSVYKTIGVDQAIVTVSVVPAIPIGIKESLMNEDLISLYPNPTNSVFYIKNESYFSGSVRIYNLEGREVESLVLNSASTGSASIIEIQNLNSGIYFVEVRFDNYVFRKKVVVLR